jgi:hypothetical protein
MAFDIKRKAELNLVAQFGTLLPDLAFYPSKGGTDDGGTSLPRPPFGVIWIDNAEKVLPNNKTYLLTGTIVWITRASVPGVTPGTPPGTGDVADHSDAVQQIYNAVLQIGPGLDPVHNLIVHGIDVSDVDEFTDAERLAHGDTISFRMGANETD